MACGCDACDTGSADLLETLDDAFVLALSGGVYVVREGETVVRRSLDGWGSTGTGAGESWPRQPTVVVRTASSAATPGSDRSDSGAGGR